MANVLRNILVDSPSLLGFSTIQIKGIWEVGVPMMPNVKGKSRTMLK